CSMSDICPPREPSSSGASLALTSSEMMAMVAKPRSGGRLLIRLREVDGLGRIDGRGGLGLGLERASYLVLEASRPPPHLGQRPSDLATGLGQSRRTQHDQ